MIKKYFALSLITASMVVAGCSSDDDDPVDPVDPTDPVDPVEPTNPAATPGVGNSAFDSIVNSDSHTTLLAAINAAGLADALDNEENDFTVFAPNDDAFAALPEGTLDGLLADVPALTRVLQYHVVPGTFNSTAISEAVTNATEEAPATLETLVVDNGVAQTVTATVGTEGTGLAVNNFNILTADVTSGDDAAVGVVHVIGDVLTPPEAPEVVEPEPDPDPMTGGGGTVSEGAGTAQAALESAGTFGTFIAAFAPQAYDDSVNVWTVFAPLDASIPAGVTPDAQNHIFVGGALSAADLLAGGSITTNGGISYDVTGTEEALLVGGNPVTLLATGDGGALVYSMDGVLQ